MGRIRTIKPEFTQDEELSRLPAETHLLAAGLLCYSDDDGYFNANPALVRAAVFPLRETSVSIHDMLTQLSNIGFIRIGKAPDGKHYGQVVKFTEHQRVNRPTPSKIKGLDILWESSVSTHGELTEHSLLEGKGKEGKGRECASLPPEKDSSPKRATRIPENFAVTDEHRRMARGEGLPNPDKELPRFIDHWRAQPGGKGLKADWDATFRNWLRRSVEFAGSRDSAASSNGCTPRPRPLSEIMRMEQVREGVSDAN